MLNFYLFLTLFLTFLQWLYNALSSNVKKKDLKLEIMTEGYQNVTVSQHVITEHVDPPQPAFPVQKHEISLTTYMVKETPWSFVPSQPAAVRLLFQSAGQQVCHYVNTDLGVSERQPARNWKPGHSSGNICPHLTSGWDHTVLYCAQMVLLQILWRFLILLNACVHRLIQNGGYLITHPQTHTVTSITI